MIKKYKYILPLMLIIMILSIIIMIEYPIDTYNKYFGYLLYVVPMGINILLLFMLITKPKKMDYSKSTTYSKLLSDSRYIDLVRMEKSIVSKITKNDPNYNTITDVTKRFEIGVESLIENENISVDEIRLLYRLFELRKLKGKFSYKCLVHNKLTSVNKEPKGF